MIQNVTKYTKMIKNDLIINYYLISKKNILVYFYFKNQLNTELLTLKGVLDSHDPRPTAGVQFRLNEVLQMWKTMKAEMEYIIQEEVEGFNKMYTDKKLPILILPKKAKEKVDKP